MTKVIFAKDVNRFNKIFDSYREDRAHEARGNFLKLYPANRLNKLTLKDYVIGTGKDTFCACVEARTRSWAYINGATSNKFGIYYGKTKSDPRRIYRFTKKFGESRNEAFRNVKGSLIDLIDAAKNKDFAAIDDNLLSQMFKAKIISLYFPKTYSNICSGEHLSMLAEIFDLDDGLYSSEYQYLLLQEKNKNKYTKNWSLPKFAAFIYRKYIFETLYRDEDSDKNERKHRTIDFDQLAKERSRIGKKSERFALAWEKNRLRGLGLEELISKIDDRTNKPGYGYDFLSFSSKDKERYIEVKTVGKDYKSGELRFFISDNELQMSKKRRNSNKYFFYLVFIGSDKKPSKLVKKSTKQIQKIANFYPSSYKARFKL